MTMKNVSNASVPAEAWKLAGFSAIIAVVMVATSGLSVCMIIASAAIFASPLFRMVDERYGVAINLVGLAASFYGSWMTVVVYLIVKILSNVCVDADVLTEIKE